MAKHWSQVAPLSTDIILPTAKGYLLKSNTGKEKLEHLLNRLKQQKKIESFSETAAYSNERVWAPPPETFTTLSTAL